MKIIEYSDFLSVDIRLGTVEKAEVFEKARKPAYKVWVNFGPEIGIKQTSAQITHHYTPSALIGKQILGCLNLGEKNIAGFISEFLLLGFSDPQGHIVLATVDAHEIKNGEKIH